MPMMIEGTHYKTGERVGLRIDDGKIVEIVDLQPANSDVETLYLAPGLVDLQINGFKGFDFNSLPLTNDSIQKATIELWGEGITTYYPTIITNSDEAIEEAVSAIADACASFEFLDNTIAGIHIEGPFISPEDGPRGAHAKKYVKAPDWELFQKWQMAACGRIKIITLSPEWSGSSEFISKCVDSGVIVAIGHTSATPEQIREAVEAGATMSTHLGNGAHLMLARHPNYIWEQLAQDNLNTFLIADGFHLPKSFLKVAMKVKGDQAMLVSDAVYLSGLEPGEYETHIGGKVILTPQGKLCTLANPKILAGSAQMLNHGIGHLVRSKLTNLETAWEMGSIRPSAFMDLSAKQGLVAGAPADFVLFKWKENQVNVISTYKSGKLVFTNEVEI